MDGAPRSSAPAAVHADVVVARKIPNPESLKRKERRHRAAEAKKSQEDAAARALAAAEEEDAIAAEAAHNQQLAAQQALLLYNRQAVAAAFAQQAASTANQSSGNRLPRSMSPPVSSATYGYGPAKEQEGCRKDVERAFGVLQARWAIVRHPARTWSVDTMWEVMTACVIMNNMIVEDEREGANELGGWDFQGPLIEPEHAPQEFEAFLQMHREIRDQDTHNQLQEDLVEHIWRHTGNQ